MPHPKYSTDEIVSRGEERYERELRDKLESGNKGRFLVINIETGDYEIDDDHLSASDRAAQAFPGAPLYAMQIGYPTLLRIGLRSPAISP